MNQLGTAGSYQMLLSNLNLLASVNATPTAHKSSQGNDILGQGIRLGGGLDMNSLYNVYGGNFSNGLLAALNVGALPFGMQTATGFGNPMLSNAVSGYSFSTALESLDRMSQSAYDAHTPDTTSPVEQSKVNIRIGSNDDSSTAKQIIKHIERDNKNVTKNQQKDLKRKRISNTSVDENGYYIEDPVERRREQNKKHAAMFRERKRIKCLEMEEKIAELEAKCDRANKELKLEKMKRNFNMKVLKALAVFIKRRI